MVLCSSKLSGGFGVAGMRADRMDGPLFSAENAGSTISPLASTGYTATPAFISAREADSISSVYSARSRVSPSFISSKPMEMGNAPDTQTRFLRPPMCST